MTKFPSLPRPSTRRAHLERLEDRLCLSVDVMFDAGVLTLTGSQADEQVSILDDGQGKIAVTTGDDRVQRWEFEDVEKVVVDLQEGNDTASFRRLRGDAPMPAVVLNLGDGNDQVRVKVDGAPQVDLDISTGEGDDSALIGLLLPAVQKVRAAAARMNVSLGGGADDFQLKSSGFNQVDLDLSAGEGDDTVGLLLPAVQKVREAAARMSVALEDGADQFLLNARGVDQLDLDLSAGEGDDSALIGLLLPAVQKVRSAAARMNVSLGDGADRFRLNAGGVDELDLDLSAGEGDDTVGLLLPAVQKVREAAARMSVSLEGGADQFRLNAGGVDQLDLDLSAGEGDDSALIGLLLPAVQKVRAAAARMNVSLGDGADRFGLKAIGVDQVDLNLAAGEGNDRILVGLLLPAVQKVRESSARMTISLDGGDDSLNYRAVGYQQAVSEIFAGEGDDNILVGLLLPAVQKVRESAARTTVDLGTGNDSARVRVRGYDIVETVITSQDDDGGRGVKR